MTQAAKLPLTATMDHRAKLAPTKLAAWAERLVEKAPTSGPARKVAENTAREAIAALVRAERCARCGRRLTDPASVEAGIGPDCLAKRGGRQAWDDYLRAFVEASRAPVSAITLRLVP